MASRFFRLKWSLLLALGILTVTPFAGAEPAATNAWKPIIFSSLDSSVITSNPISPSTQPVPPANLQGSLFENTTPVPSFNFGPAPMPDTRRRLQKKSGDSADWVFQTPAEIMGVAPDQTPSNRKRNDDDPQRNLTPMERYLEGRNPMSKSRMNSSQPQDFSGDENSQTNGDSYTPDLINAGLDDFQSQVTAGQSLSGVPNTVVGNNLFASPNQDSVWANTLGTPTPQSTPHPVNYQQQQQADMDQFRRMLNPGLAPVATAATTPDSATSFRSQISLPAPSSTLPLANPIGASFAPLSSGIGQPTPLAQLPGITGPANPQPSLTPSWAPQPAPWTSPNPQPFAIPQRKF